MARIRSLKPEFPQSESIGRLSRDGRLLFVQLFTVADDDGRARAASRMLASLLYPYDDDAPSLIDDWLAELEENGMIRRYVVDGSAYLEIIHWSKHQKIDHKSASRLPACPENSETLAKPREASRSLAPDLGPRIKDQDQSKYVGASAPAAAMDVALNLAVAPRAFEDFWKAYPKRRGANPREPARKAFGVALKAGIDPDIIVAAAGRYADELRRDGKLGTQFVARALTWLHERRWGDYPVAESTTGEARSRGVFVPIESDPWRAWCDHYQIHGGPNGLRVAPRAARCGPAGAEGWNFPTEWPPGHVAMSETSNAA